MTRNAKPWINPNYWENRFRALDTPWDRGFASPSVVELGKKLELPPQSTMIVPGCGFGHEVLHFARLGYDVSAVDWSPTAAREVRTRAKRHGLSIEILCSDFWAIPDSWFGTFHILLEHAFFCSIDPLKRRDYVEQAARLLDPKGQLMGVFLVNERASSNYNAGPPYWITREEVCALFESSFDIDLLEPSPYQTPPFAGLEWWARFTKRSSNLRR